MHEKGLTITNLEGSGSQVHDGYSFLSPNSVVVLVLKLFLRRPLQVLGVIPSN